MSKKADMILVRITGTGINEVFKARSHELIGLPAGTYHKFILQNGIEIFYNDFGVRQVSLQRGVVADD